MTTTSGAVPEGHVKMSELARRSGVPSATIKHYLREGLLPEPVRTSRNMAYYDVRLVPRIRRIKELQRRHYLPLKEIRRVLESEALPTEDDTIASAIAAVHARVASHEQRTRTELLDGGMPEAQLDWLIESGFVSPRREDGEEIYEGEDLELLRVLGAARRAGLKPEMLPVTILGEYVAAIRELARVEVQLFREGVVPRAAPEELALLSEAATTLSERLVVLLRRRMLVPALRAEAERAVEGEGAEPDDG